MTRSYDDPPADVLSDPRLGPVVAAFQDELDAGRAPNRAEYVRRYPDLAAGVDGCLRAIEFIRAAMTPPLDVGPRPREAVAPGGTIGDFRVLREIGRGGMGVVFEAEQISLGRRVALKILPALAALDERARQRFRHEAQAAAALRHPHIVPVHGVGQTGDVHYFWMPLVQGRSLAAAIHDATGPVPAVPGDTLADPATSRSPEAYRRVASLMHDAADALDHAHQSGVIHRDIKPANFLLDDKGHLWLLDFGLARLPGSDLTGTADVMGTLRYMSPEQASGRAVALDGQSDVYSLGATFYEYLTYRAAFPATDRETLLRQILSAEPVAPRKLAPGLPVDLETIVIKAMAKDLADRYRSAHDLRDDLDRFLADRPILATPPTALQRAGKWVRRNRVVVGLAASSAVVTLAAVTAVLAVSRRELAVKQAATQKALDGETNMRVDLDRALAGEKAARAAERRTAYAHTLAYAVRETEAGNSAHAADLLNRTPPECRDWEFGLVRGTLGRDVDALTVHAESAPVSVRVVPRANSFSVMAGSSVRTYDLTTWAEQSATVIDPSMTGVLSGSNPRTFVATVRKHFRFRTGVVDAPTDLVAFDLGVTPPRVLATATVPHPVRSLTDHPHDARVAVALHDGSLILWGWETDKIEEILPPSPKAVVAMKFDPTGSRLAYVREGSLFIHPLSGTGPPVRMPLGSGSIVSLAWDATGSAVAVGGAEGSLTLFKAPFDRTFLTGTYGSGNAVTPCFSPDGRFVALAFLGTKTVTILETRTGSVVRTVDGHAGGTRWVQFVYDGRGLMTYGADSRLRLWDVSGGGLIPAAGGAYAIDPTGQRLARLAADRPDAVELLDVTTREVVRTVTLPPVPSADHHTLVPSFRFTADGARLLVSNYDTRRVEFDVRSGERLGRSDSAATVGWPPVSRPGDVIEYGSRLMPHVTLSPDGATAVIARVTDLAIHDTRTDRPLAPPLARPGSGDVGFSADGRFFFHLPTAYTRGGTLSVCDLAAGRWVGTVPDVRTTNKAFAVRPDGHAVAILASPDEVVEIDWALRTRRTLWKGEQSGAQCLAYGPGGTRLAVGVTRYRNRQGGVMILDVATGDEVVTVPVELPVNRAEFSADGSSLVLSDSKGLIKTIVVSDRPGLSPSRARLTLASSAAPSLLAGEAGIPKSSFPNMTPMHKPDVSDERRRTAAEVRKAGDVDRIDRALAAHVAAMCQTTAPDLLLLYKVAAVYLAGDDREAYRGLCQDLRKRLLPKASAASQSVLLRLMTLGPDALGDPQTLIDLIPTVPGHNSAENTRLYLEGTALYRAGRYEEALPPLQKALALSKTINFGMQCAVFLAMTEFRLGQADAAKKHLAEVDAWVRDYLGPTPMPRASPDRKVDIVLPVLRAEAAKLMGIP